jgi:M6 family metalloprotease-like protein
VNRFLKLLLTLTAMLITLLLVSTVASAAPAYNGERQYAQPTGESFTASLGGDEWFNYLATSDGYLVENGSDSYWYYTLADADGLVSPSAARYLIDAAPQSALTTDDIGWLREKKLSTYPAESMNMAPQMAPQYGPQQVEFLNKPADNQPILVLLVSFDDQTGANVDTPISDTPINWAAKFFGAADSVKSYYEEVSNGQLTFIPAGETGGTANDGVVSVTLPYAHPNTNTVTNNLNQKIVADALAAADGYVVFSDYDTDSDGYIEKNELHIVTIVAGYERSYSDEYSPSVWAHRWGISGSVAVPVLDGKRLCDGTHGDGYTQLGEKHATHMATFGTICHELGHDIGLPDLYDTDSSNGSSKGVGVFSLMGSGNWCYTSGEEPGQTPSHLDAWSKLVLQWVTPDVPVAGTHTYSIKTIADGYNMLLIPISGHAREYFLIENRGYTGYDAGLIGYTKSNSVLGDKPGIVIWHIDENVIIAQYAAGKVNADETHKGVDLEESDGSNGLDADAGPVYDYFFVKNGIFGPATTPNSNLYDATPTNIFLKVLDDPASTMQVNLTSVITNITFTATAELQEGNANVTLGAVAGTFTATGGDAPVTYSLVADDVTPANSADNNRFEINGSSVNITGLALTAGTYCFNVRATDADGDTYDKACTITVVPPTPAFTAAAGAASLTPVAGAGNTVTLTVKDSASAADANFDGDKTVTVTGYEAAPNSSYGSFNGTVLESDGSTNITVSFTDGVASAALILNKAGVQTIGFSIAGVVTPAANNLTITPVPNTVTSMALTQDITAPASNGGQFAQQPVITLKDAYGNICTNDSTTTITASKKDAGAWSLTGTTAVQASSGVVTFTNLGATNPSLVNNAQLAFNGVGTEVTSAAVTLPAIPAYTATAGAVSLTPVAGASNTVTLTVKDSSGTADTNFDGNKTVTITGYETAPNGSFGSFNGTALDSDGSTNVTVNFTNGVATAPLILNKADEQTIGFSITGVATPAANSLTITPVPAAVSGMTLTQDITAPTTYGGTFDQQPMITLKDAYGNICTNDSTTTVTASNKDGGEWTLTGIVTVTATSGVVTFTNLGATNTAQVNNAQLAFNGVGTEVTSTTVTLPAVPAFTATAGAASLIPVTGAANMITLTVKNSLGATDADFDGNKTITVTGYEAAPNNSYGSFNGTSLESDGSTNVTLTFTDGVASAALILNKADAQTISFSITGVATPAANNLNITPVPAAAASMTLTQDIAAPVNYSEVFIQQPVITLKDTYGNVCTNNTMTVTAAGAGGSSAWTLTGTITVQAVSGVVTFTDLGATNDNLVENARLTFSAAGIPGITSATVTLPAPSADATIKTGSTLANQAISGSFAGGATVDDVNSELTVTVPDASKTNAALSLTKGNAYSTIKYLKSTTAPSADGDYTGTYTGTTQITVADGDVIWLLVTAQDGDTKLYYKLTVTVSAPVIGGGGGGGGGTPSTEETATEFIKGDTMNISVGATVTSDSGTSNATLSDSTVDVLIGHAAAAEDAGKNATLEIRVPETDEADSVNLTLAGKQLSDLATKTEADVTITTGIGSLTFGADAIEAISTAAGASDITVSIDIVAPSSLSAEAKTVVGNRPVYDFSIKAGSTQISSFGGNAATVSVPYKPAAGEDPNNIIIYYISDSGVLTIVPNCVYDAATGLVSFRTEHFSKFAVSYKTLSFKDVSGWYTGYVSYLTARGIMNGVGEDTFMPGGEITRAEFIAMLARLSGDDLSKYKTSSFADVKTTDWYFGVAEWAKENKVAEGYDGKFNPTDKITRQDMAVLLVRYAGQIDYKLPETLAAKVFPDKAAIASYAVSAVTAVQRAGIMTGLPDGTFGPTANATRAEAAKVIADFMTGMFR